MKSWILRNAAVVNEGRILEADVLIAGGRIEQVGGATSDPKATDIDLGGAWLLPGMIDDQVHFREPGFEHKANIATESRAAVAGGTTSYLEMPNCVPQTVTPEALLDKHTRAATCSVANYGFYFGATNENLEAIKAVDVTKACGVKVFMGASTGDMLVDDPNTLDGIFASCPPRHRHALRGHPDHPRQRGESPRRVRRRGSHRATPRDPLGGGMLQIVLLGRLAGQTPR